MTGPRILLTAQDGAVLVLTMNRPEKANAMNQAMHQALVSGLEAAGRDTGVRAVLLCASGSKVFSAGADLKEFAELERRVGARNRRALLMRTLYAALDCPKPLVAAVQAKALGAGCMLALLADEVILADTAEFGMPEIMHGMPTPVGVAILAARGGMSVTRQMVQSGAPIDARRAHEMGLADGLVNFSSLQVNSMERARALAALSGPAFEANKKFINAPLKAALQAAFAEADRM
jgi:enoyl-CoA hydratase/carnithine racemase